MHTNKMWKLHFHTIYLYGKSSNANWPFRQFWKIIYYITHNNNLTLIFLFQCISKRRLNLNHTNPVISKEITWQSCSISKAPEATVFMNFWVFKFFVLHLTSSLYFFLCKNDCFIARNLLKFSLTLNNLGASEIKECNTTRLSAVIYCIYVFLCAMNRSSLFWLKMTLVSTTLIKEQNLFSPCYINKQLQEVKYVQLYLQTPHLVINQINICL